MNVIQMATKLYSRRDELKAVFPEDVYAKHLSAATGAVTRWMEAHKSDNPIDSAIAAAKSVQGHDVREETARQFLLVAGLELAEVPARPVHKS